MDTITIIPQQIFAGNQILTVSKAKELMGKTIATTSSEYHMNEPCVNIFTIASIESEWDRAALRIDPNGKHATHQAYWLSYMKPKQIENLKKTLMLIDINGGWWHRAHTYENLYETPTFTGSDSDRTVFYIVL